MSVSWIRRKSLKTNTSKPALVTNGERPNLILLLSISALFVGVGIFVVNRSNAAAPPRAAAPVITGDTNGDHTVGASDLSKILSKWSTSDAAADINHDGTVNIGDLSVILSNWK